MNQINAKSSHLPASPANRIQLLFPCIIIRFSCLLVNLQRMEDADINLCVCVCIENTLYYCSGAMFRKLL